jgi:hypothetical protein
MFDRLLSIFRRNKRAEAPARNGFLSPKEEPVKKPTVMLADRRAPLPAVIQDKPPAILLPGVSIAPASKPVEVVEPVVQLPPDVDPNQVIIVRHDAKRLDSERFKYADKPLKPLSGDGRRPDVIKYNDKKGEETIKYKASPVTPRVEPESSRGEVFKYTPRRIEIKS